jgi:hypothetical protein
VSACTRMIRANIAVLFNLGFSFDLGALSRTNLHEPLYWHAKSKLHRLLENSEGWDTYYFFPQIEPNLREASLDGDDHYGWFPPLRRLRYPRVFVIFVAT